MPDIHEHALLAVEDRVAVLTLNRPEKLNALSDSMIQSAIAALGDGRPIPTSDASS